MPQTQPLSGPDQLQDLINNALKAGAESADAMLVDSTSLSVTWHAGKLESLEQSESGDLGLRVIIGKQQAIVSTTDRRPETLKEIVERAVAMAKAAPPDEYCGLASSEEIAKIIPKLQLADNYDIGASALIEMAREAETAALSVKGVTNCESSDAGASKSTIFMAASNGFSGSYSRTGYSISVSALAGDEGGMERDYDFASCVFRADLPAAASIGLRAGERTIKNLNGRKMPTCKIPVIMDSRESSGLLQVFAGAISGASIARGTSFLKDYLGKPIFSHKISIIDDPFRERGLRSRAFDGEGLLPSMRKIIDQGVLTTWLLDLRSARQLKMKSTGHASRGASSMPSPSPSNFYMESGTVSVPDLIRDIKQGFFVTELMGSGVNGVTGDYSQAAKGFWIENGEITFPVNEMTIAGNLKDMFLNTTPANDLIFRYGFDAPTLRIENMTIAGV